MTPAPARFLASLIAALTTILVLLGITVGTLLTPLWVFGEQDRAGSTSLTGYTGEEVRIVTGAILADLIVGPPEFDVAARGEPVLNPREREHMRDVRTVMLTFIVASSLAGIALLVTRRLTGGSRGFWRGVAVGSAFLACVVAALGGFVIVAFNLAFETFHRLFFASGTYLFDPASERLVQLFPEQFWYDSAVAAGVLLVLLSAVTFALSRRRLRQVETPAAAPGVTVGVAAS